MTRRDIPLCIVLTISLAMAAPTAVADTAMLLRSPDRVVFAATVDTSAPDGAVILNQRGVRKKALVSDSLLPGSWVSGYGSLTVNLLGREFPIAGVNQVGLTVHAQWTEPGPAPVEDPRPVLNSLQWVQFCLDSYENIDQVVQSARASKILGTAPLQYLACQPDGRCAMLEARGEKAVIRAHEELPLPLLTGRTYADSLDYLNRTLGYGGEPVTPDGPGPLPRFARAAREVNLVRTGTASTLTVERAFGILGSFVVEGNTRWLVVLDPDARTIHWRPVGVDRPASVSMLRKSVPCGSPVQVVRLSADIPEGAEGPQWQDYDRSANLEQVTTAAAAIPPLAQLPESAWGPAVAYPEGLECSERPPMKRPSDPASVATE